MSRPASDKTMLARANREIRDLRKRLTELGQTSEKYRVRATKAEQELTEWKSRFDRLLEFREATGVIGDRHD